MIRSIEPGRVVHGDLRTETAMPKIRPITDLAVADAHDVGKSIAGHVSCMNRLGGIVKEEGRELFFIAWQEDTTRWSKPGFGQRCVPGESSVFRDQDIGM